MTIRRSSERGATLRGVSRARPRPGAFSTTPPHTPRSVTRLQCKPCRQFFEFRYAMARSASVNALAQGELFAGQHVFAIPGFRYQTSFLSPAQERLLLEAIRGLPLQEAQYRQWRANRRTVSFGGKYDFTANELMPAEPIPSFLFALRARAAAWSGIEASRFNHALIAEYRAGTQLGWHRDVSDFESVVGVSLAGAARMRFRPHPPRLGQRRAAFAIDLEPRSIYTMQMLRAGTGSTPSLPRRCCATRSPFARWPARARSPLARRASIMRFSGGSRR